MKQLELIRPQPDDIPDFIYKTIVDDWKVYWKLMMIDNGYGVLLHIKPFISENGNQLYLDVYEGDMYAFSMNSDRYDSMINSYNNHIAECELLR